jgi:hypothetical protein
MGPNNALFGPIYIFSFRFIIITICIGLYNKQHTMTEGEDVEQWAHMTRRLGPLAGMFLFFRCFTNLYMYRSIHYRHKLRMLPPWRRRITMERTDDK